MNKMKIKRLTALIVALSMLFSVEVFADNEEYATRGEVAELLLEAADYYNPGVVKEDIIKGYEDGQLHEERFVTRAEALVMLKRAFGNLPKPRGHNARVGFTAEEFTDVPLWAQQELSDVFESGIVAGTSKGLFSPKDNVTRKQMELFIDRVYALFGKNVCDDFYATVNKKALDEMKIPYGEYIEGTLYSMQSEAAEQIGSIIQTTVAGGYEKGTPKQKMADLYRCVTDVKTINKNSIQPISKYLDKVDAVKNISELSLLQTELLKELCVAPFMGFSLTVDFKDSSKYALCFSAMQPLMNKELYFDTESEQQKAYLSYLETILKVCGEADEEAADNVRKYFELEKELAEEMLSTQQQNDAQEIYNVYTYNKLKAMLPDCNLDKLLEASFLKKDENVIVADTGLLNKLTQIYNQSNIDILRTAAKISILYTWGEILSFDIEEAAENLRKTIYGTTGGYTRSQKAAVVLQNTMPEYLGELYVKKYFDEESKKEVLRMAEDIKAVFKIRISSLSWMSDKTKEKALKKLDAMKIQIGYPDSFATFLDDVEITSPKNGGTYFSNMLAINKASAKHYASLQEFEVDYSPWSIAPYTVNAGYDLTGNSITFPAAILQEPLYSKNASYEENLGAIGYIIAHEMIHAFDNNGALFDERGNMNNWWEEEDYEHFEKLCEGVVNFYDGYEFVPAVTVNGRLTLNENVADLGAAACITELAGKNSNPDYKELFSSMAKTFAGTYTREYAEYEMQYDVHADSKARVNCVVVHLDEFYEAFGVEEGDGMYVKPEDRITIW